MKLIKYYVDDAGHYLGGWDINPPSKSVEVPSPPEDARQLWKFPGWGDKPKSEKDRKLEGVEFQGVMCSATKEDMWGLASIAPWVAAGNNTSFEFDNGNTLILTPENYQEFTLVWGQFRASFFPIL